MILLISIIIAVTFAYTVNRWFDYRKVAVKTPGYPIVTGITLLFLGFMAFTGVSALSDSLLKQLLGKIGLEALAPDQARWYALGAFIVLAIAVVLILRGKEQKALKIQKTTTVVNGVADLTTDSGNINVTQIYNKDDSTHTDFFIEQIRRKDAEIDELKGKLSQSISDEEKTKLSSKINQPEEEKETFRQKAENLEQRLREFKDIKIIKQANEILNEKGIDEALDYLESIDYEHALKHAREHSKALLIQAGLYVINNQHSKADDTYRKSIELNRNVENTLDYANYLFDQNQFKDAIQQLSHLKLEANSLSKDKQASLSGSLANAYSKNNQLKEAEKAYKEALGIYRELAKNNPGAFKSSVATTLNNLAVLNRKDNRLKEAEDAYKEVLDIRRELAKNNPNAYGIDLANTLVMGVDLLNQPKANLAEARSLLLQFKGIPKADSLLSIIDDLEKDD